ncbi:lengsin isoform X1 [Ranitomeya imitator]|uniref:lengsin isoform X1 n=1 Tax=Ranitomeya imitator TaxID=111125 RepID=UPI0037E88449
MDDDINTTEDPSYIKCDEVDGSVISSLRRRRGVKVTGKYLPPLEWEKTNTCHSVSSINNYYFEGIHNDMENYFQASDMSTKLLLKDKRQSTTQKDDRGDESSKAEQEKQRMESVVSIHTATTKTVKNVPEENINSKQSSKNINEKPSEDLFPLGLAIPKETLKELKSIVKESPLTIPKNKWTPKSTTSRTLIRPPTRSENPSEKSGLTFETFMPNKKEIQKLQSTKTPEENERQDLLMGQILPDHGESQKDEQLMQPIQSFEGKQNIIPNKSNNTAGIKFDHPSTDESSCSGSKQVYSASNGSQNPLQLVSSVEQIKQQIAREDVRFVRFEAADLHGVSRSKTIPARFFQERAIGGIYMPRSYLELTLSPKDNEVDHINSMHFKSDIILKPELDTFRILPWTEKTARVICDSFTFLGDPLLTSPRFLAKRLLHQLEEIGFLLHSAFTYEFCVFAMAEIINAKTVSFPAVTLLTDHDQLFIQELFDGMYYIGGKIESFSSSIGPGQMEISFQPDYGLQAADNAFTFKTAIKEVAKKHGSIASFYTDMVGFYNSGILSHSLWDIQGKKNLFYSGKHVQELSDIGKNWLSGLLLHSAALSCLVAPGVACRKHLSKDIKESQENISATWGLNNNGSTFNVKSYCKNGTYVENKLCSAMANPYLVLAATVAAGLDGIKKGLNFFDSLNSNTDLPELKTWSIPLKLEDALTALQEDKCIRASLGEPFIQYFIAMKQYELETEEIDSERNKFLEYFI